MKKPTEEVFRNIFDGILSTVKKETNDNFSQQINEITQLLNNVDDYYFSITYPLHNSITEAFTRKYPTTQTNNIHKLVWVFTNYQLIKAHLDKLIATAEGRACHADKTRYIIKSYIKYLISNGKTKIIVSTKEKHYWIPTFLDMQEWIELFHTLYAFTYGDVMPYIKFLTGHLIKLQLA